MSQVENARTLFILAAGNGDLETMERLFAELEHRINLNWQGPFGMNSALGIACERRHIHVAQWLLTLPGMSISARNCFGRTILSRLGIVGYAQIADLLLEHGADLDDVDPFHFAKAKGGAPYLHVLLKHGLNADMSNHQKATLLIVAARFGRTNSVSILLKHGASVGAANYQNRTALHAACLARLKKVVVILLNHGVGESIDAQDCEGNTAVCIAASKRMEAVVEELVQHGANLRIQNKSGKSAFDLLMEYKPIYFEKRFALYLDQGHVGKAKRLYDAMQGLFDVNQANVSRALNEEKSGSVLARAVYFGRKDVVSWLLQETSIDPNRRIRYHHSALIQAVRRGDCEFIPMLLNHGANIEDREIGLEHWNALHWAAAKGNECVVRTLLEHGASISSRDKRGQAALHHAVREGHEKVVVALLENGAFVGHEDYMRDTALIKACETGSVAIVQILLRAGADKFINKRNQYGASALVRAVHRGCDQVIPILVNHGARSADLDSGEVLCAVSELNMNTIRLLFGEGMNLYERDLRGERPFETMVWSLRPENLSNLLIIESEFAPRCFFSCGA